MEKEKQKKAEKKIPKKKKDCKKIAIVRVRGSVKVKRETKDTLHMLNLYKQNNCVILDASPSSIGMLKKVQGFVTWGEIDDQTLKLLKEKRGKKDSKIFRLHPPRKGFKRKGIKLPFNKGGALGYREEKINELIKKMI